MDPTPTPPPVSNSPYPRPHLEGGGPTCPKCSSTNTKEIKYTWWGGVLAPKLMNLQKCNACGFQFNRSTNKSVSNAIWAYNLIALGVSLIVLFFVFSSMF